MFDFTDTFYWLVLNNGMALVGLLCAAIFLQVIDWYLKFRLPQVLFEGIKYLKNHPELGIAFLFILVVISALATETRGFWSHGVSTNDEPPPWDGEATRSLGLALGAVGGLYALILAGRRLRVTEANLFNDRLKSGLSFLNDRESDEARCAGILLLKNYACETPVGSTERETVVDVIHGYLVSRAKMPSSGEEKSNPILTENFGLPYLRGVSEDRRDIRLAIMALTQIISVKARRKQVGEFDVSSVGIDFVGLDLRNVNLSNLDLSSSTFLLCNLEDAIFIGAKLDRAKFIMANLVRANFSQTICLNTSFYSANLRGAFFDNASVDKNTNFSGANLAEASIIYPTQFEADLKNSDLSGAKIWLHGSFETFVNDSFIFDFANPPELRLDGNQVEAEASMAYEFVKRNKVNTRVMRNDNSMELYKPGSLWWQLKEDEEKQK